MHDPKLIDMDCFVCIETVFGFFFFLPATCGGRTMVEKQWRRRYRERNVERDLKFCWI